MKNSIRPIIGSTFGAHIELNIAGSYADVSIVGDVTERIDTTVAGLQIRITPKLRQTPIQRPPLPIPSDFDPEQERRRSRQGGCCGKPSV